MNTPKKARRRETPLRKKTAEPTILALCTAHFLGGPGGGQPSSRIPRKQQQQQQPPLPPSPSPPRRRQKKTTGPRRDAQTSVSSREIVTAWPAAYRAQCCTPKKAPLNRRKPVGYRLTVGTGLAGVATWLGAGNAAHHPLAAQFAGAGLLAGLQLGGDGDGDDASPAGYRAAPPLRYTPPSRSAVPSPTAENASSPSSSVATGDGRGVWSLEHDGCPVKRFAAFDDDDDDDDAASTQDDSSTPHLAELLEAALSASDDGPPLPDLVPDGFSDDEEDAALRPAMALQTDEPATPTGLSYATAVFEYMDVDKEPMPPPEPRALCTPARKRAPRPAAGLMTPPPSAGKA